MVPYVQTGILPSGKKVIPKQKFGRGEQHSGRTCCRPCSCLGCWLSSASFTHSSSSDEIKAAKCLHVSVVPSLCQCSKVWLRLTLILWGYHIPGCECFSRALHRCSPGHWWTTSGDLNSLPLLQEEQVSEWGIGSTIVYLWSKHISAKQGKGKHLQVFYLSVSSSARHFAFL